MMKRVLLLVCLWLCLGLAGHADLNEKGAQINSVPIPKGGDTALVGNDGLIVIEIGATGSDELVNGVTVNIENANFVASASVTLSNGAIFSSTSFSNDVPFNIMTVGETSNIASGDVVSFQFNLKLKDDAELGEVVTLN
ncbi:MAG: hypothetical protein O3A77_04270, partial [bacterium]|nr:hypothetical protein [bacterium]